MKKILFFLIFLSNHLFAHEVSIFLEQNVAKVASKPSYKKVDFLIFSKRNDFRIRIDFQNRYDYSLKAIVIRYSIKLIVQRESSNFETISLISSNLRESEIKPNSKKSLYIYSINSLFREIIKFKNAGYEPVALKLEIMKEPKKGEDILFKTAVFEIKKER